MISSFVVPCCHPRPKKNVGCGSQAKTLTSHCLAVPDLYLSCLGKKPNVKPPLLLIQFESVEQIKTHLDQLSPSEGCACTRLELCIQSLRL